MGVGASTHVKEIRIDQNDEKWSSPLPKDDDCRKRSVTFGKRFSSADIGGSSHRRNKNLSSLLETTERRALDAEQRVRQLEREVASLEAKKIELSQEVEWLKKQLAEHVRHIGLTEKSNEFNGDLSLGSTMNGRHEACDELKVDVTSMLLKQEKRHEEQMLKMKTEMTKEIQELKSQAQIERLESEKENKALQDRLREIRALYESKRNQRADEANVIDPDPFVKLQSEATLSNSKLLNDGLAALHASLNSQNFADLINGGEKFDRRTNGQRENQACQEKKDLNGLASVRPIFSATKRRSLAAMSPTRRRHSFEPKQRLSIGIDHNFSKNQDSKFYENGSVKGLSSIYKRKDSKDEKLVISRINNRIISSHGRGSTKPDLSILRTGSIDRFENVPLAENLSHHISRKLDEFSPKLKIMVDNPALRPSIGSDHTMRMHTPET